MLTFENLSQLLKSIKNWDRIRTILIRIYYLIFSFPVIKHFVVGESRIKMPDTEFEKELLYSALVGVTLIIIIFLPAIPTIIIRKKRRLIIAAMERYGIRQPFWDLAFALFYGVYFYSLPFVYLWAPLGWVVWVGSIIVFERGNPKEKLAYRELVHRMDEEILRQRSQGNLP